MFRDALRNRFGYPTASRPVLHPASVLIPSRKFARRLTGRIDAGNPKSDNLFLYLHQHPRERLIFAFTDFGFQHFQTGNGAERGQQPVDIGGQPGDKEIDSFGA